MRQMDIDPGKRRCKLLDLELHVLCRFRVTYHYNRDNGGATDNEMEVSQVGGSTFTAGQRHFNGIFHESLPATYFFMASCSSGGYCFKAQSF